MINFVSLGHAFASAISDVHKALKGVEKVTASLASNTVAQTAVEAVTAATFGTSAVEVERAVFAVAGELAAALSKGDAAVSQHLTDAGLDAQVIAELKAVLQKVEAVKL
jgi:hypothetical protein